MSTAQRHAPALEAPAEAAHAPLRLLRDAPAWLAIVVLVAAFAIVFIVLALLHPVPVVYPDESLYGQLAASIGHGDGLSWRGEHVDLRAALYVYAISPAWMVAGGHTAYTLAKIIGALALCSTAVPIWFLLRRAAPPWVAIAAAALTLAGTWMIAAAALVTETFSLPLATASLCATVAALRKPGSRYVWLALGLALLATAARIQCVVLLPSLLASLLLDVAFAGRLWRTRARAHAAPVLTCAALVACGAVAYAVFGGDLFGSGGGYDTVAGYHPKIGDVIHMSLLQALVLGLSTGVLPMAIVLGCLLRPAAWRDDVMRPTLVVALPVTVAFCLQSGWFFAGIMADNFGAYWTSQRYVVYSGPLIIATAVLASTRPRVLDRLVAAVAVAGMIPLLALPDPQVLYEERTLFAVATRVHDVLPDASGATSALLWGGATALLWAALWVAGRRRRWPATATRALVAALGVGLLAQSATAWNKDLETAGKFRAGSPADLRWIDHHSTGPVGVLIAQDPGGELADMELFNRHVARIYVPKGINDYGWRLIGPACHWDVAPKTGRMVVLPGCPAAPRELLIEDTLLHMTFSNERRSASDPHVGRLVVLDATPRVRSLIRTPCERIVRGFWMIGTMEAPPQRCTDELDMRLWSDTPGRLLIRFRGAPSIDHTASVSLEQHSIPAGRDTEIVLPVRRGALHYQMVLDWADRSELSPALLSVELVQDGRRRSLL